MAIEMRFLAAAFNERRRRLVPPVRIPPTDLRPLLADPVRAAMALSNRSFSASNSARIPRVSIWLLCAEIVAGQEYYRQPQVSPDRRVLRAQAKCESANATVPLRRRAYGVYPGGYVNLGLLGQHQIDS